jgi:glycosyltransferase involved in cell wall biosynthesis
MQFPKQLNDKNMQQINISFVLVEPTPYWNLLLNNIKKSNVNLRVNYQHKKFKLHPWNIYDETAGCGDIYYFESILKATYNILKQIIREKPNIMIIAGYRNIRLLILLLLCRILRVPFAFYSDTLEINKERSMMRSMIRSGILNYVFRNAKFILSTGQIGINSFKAMGCPENKLKNLPFAVDIEEPLIIDQGTKNYATWVKERFAPGETLIFICAGMLVPRKGYEMAIESFAKAVKNWPERKAVLLIAGDGPKLNELEEAARSLGLSERIHFLGWLQPDQMKGLFHAGDVLVHPSRWDPYSVAVLEAMSWRIPVLASNQTMAAVDRVTHGESGFIHHVDDVEALASHMSYFLKDPELARKMGTNAREIAEQWPISRCVQTIMELL